MPQAMGHDALGHLPKAVSGALSGAAAGPNSPVPGLGGRGLRDCSGGADGAKPTPFARPKFNNGNPATATGPLRPLRVALPPLPATQGGVPADTAALIGGRGLPSQQPPTNYGRIGLSLLARQREREAGGSGGERKFARGRLPDGGESKSPPPP